MVKLVILQDVDWETDNFCKQFRKGLKDLKLEKIKLFYRVHGGNFQLKISSSRSWGMSQIFIVSIFTAINVLFETFLKSCPTRFFCLLKIGTLSVKSIKKLWLFCTNYKIYRIKLFYEHSISVFSKGGRYYGDLLYILYLNIAMRAEMNLSILEYWAPLLALLSDWNWYLACVAWHTDSSQ